MTFEHELTSDRLVCRFREIEIYSVSGDDCPDLLSEIGRIREREFRKVGAGRSVTHDIDEFDTGTKAYRQLVAWDPVYAEIVSMYRYRFCRDAVLERDLQSLRTARLFTFSPEFVDTVLHDAVELGRSVVNSETKRAILGLYAVWAGLGAIVVEHPEVRYFFGNVSIYRTWPPGAVDALLGYLARYHGGEEGAVTARPGAEYRGGDVTVATAAYPDPDQARGYDRLTETLKTFGVGPPPILTSYLRATTELRAYATAADDDFGDAWETAITVSTAHLTPKTRSRFIDSYRPVNRGIL